MEKVEIYSTAVVVTVAVIECPDCGHEELSEDSFYDEQTFRCEECSSEFEVFWAKE